MSRPEFPGRLGPRAPGGVLYLATSGIGRGSGGGGPDPNAVPLPFQYTWQAGDPITGGVVPSWGDTWGAWANTPALYLDSAASKTYNSYTSPYSPVLRYGVGATDKGYGVKYLGQYRDGKHFDVSSGLRVMLLAAGANDPNVGFNSRIMIWDAEDGLANGTSEWDELRCCFGVSARTNKSPDWHYVYSYKDGSGTVHCTGQPVSGSGNMPNDCWMALGIELPANFDGQWTARIKGLGGSAYTATASYDLPAGDWSGTKLSGLGFYNWSQYSGAAAFASLVWVGTLADDWPI